MSSARIATRYAAPLLDLAKEQAVLEAVKSDIQAFLSVCEENRDFLLMLKSPVIPPQRKSVILKKIWEGKVQELTLKFLEIITRKSREDLLPEIAQEFMTLYYKQEGFQEATITTATTLDASLKQSFEQLVHKLSGKKPLLSERIDSSLVGGYTLQMGDRKLDKSVSGQLRTLQLEFKKGKN